MVKNELANLLDKKMDRLTFLKHVGVGFVAITGVSSVIKTMGGLGTSARQTAGYGASTYGTQASSR